jgi:hypothetical protein
VFFEKKDLVEMLFSNERTRIDGNSIVVPGCTLRDWRCVARKKYLFGSCFQKVGDMPGDRGVCQI